MLTLYRIIDNTENAILAEDIGDYDHAFQSLCFLREKNPSNDIILEEYQVQTVKGYGRDPDLH